MSNANGLLNACEKISTINLNDWPPLEWNERERDSLQIVNYLQQHIALSTGSKAVLPSVMVLADFFKCCEMAVLDALLELKQRTFYCQINGLDAPIPIYAKARPVVQEEQRYSTWLKKPLTHLPTAQRAIS